MDNGAITMRHLGTINTMYMGGAIQWIYGVGTRDEIINKVRGRGIDGTVQCEINKPLRRKKM